MAEQATIFDPSHFVSQTISRALQAANQGTTKTLTIDDNKVTVPYPFPSPIDWRDHWIYFLMTDRFNNPDKAPNSTVHNPSIAWNDKYGSRQGGTFKGVQQQLAYIANLGATAIWISPVLKNSRPDNWEYNYHGYGTQDFLTIDGRFASDGTSATAERELIELVEEAHARNLYVILDIVLNHTARVFDYVLPGGVVDHLQDEALLNAPLGGEPPIQWLNGYGYPRPDWQNTLPPADQLGPDDAVWPVELQRADFFRRRGSSVRDDAYPKNLGDFGTMRQLVVEYDAQNDPTLNQAYGANPVLAILIRCYEYLIAKFDIDAFRIDTVKYVDPNCIEIFGNAIREYALSIRKKNFFTFGEIYDNDETLAQFVGRHSTESYSFGIDAALDFPLFFQLPNVAKALNGVESIRELYRHRKQVEQDLVSSHGEASRFFVTFLDNHDQNERFNQPGTLPDQVNLGIALLFCLQGIPCLYYGTEQGLQGASTLDSKESVREALWGKTPLAFDTNSPQYQQIQQLAALRTSEPALRYGRLYFRQVSGGDGQGFGYSSGQGGLVAFSRILGDREIVVIANTHPTEPFSGHVVVDLTLSRTGRTMICGYSNLSHFVPSQMVQIIPNADLYENGQLTNRNVRIAAVPVNLKSREVQILLQ